jgi:hypothetical protein
MRSRLVGGAIAVACCTGLLVQPGVAWAGDGYGQSAGVTDAIIEPPHGSVSVGSEGRTAIRRGQIAALAPRRFAVPGG